MKFKRAFVFGCSFTQYSSTTWAHILSWDLDIPVKNFGIAGIGNEGIFCRMVECDLIYKFTEDDLIMVMWSAWHREDRYLNDSWKAFGDIFHKNFYDDDFIKKYWSLGNDIIKNSTAIISANRMFKPQFQGHTQMPIVGDLTNLSLSKEENRLIDIYKPQIPLNNIFEYNNKTEFCKLFNDNHPDLLEHLRFAKEVVYKSLNLTLKPKTEELCHFLHEEFINLLRNEGSNMADNDKKQMIQKMTPELIKKFKN